jgi:hypothetical protein
VQGLRQPEHAEGDEEGEAREAGQGLTLPRGRDCLYSWSSYGQEHATSRESSYEDR